MSDQSIIIRIREEGAERVRRSVEDLGAAGERSRRTFDALKGAIIGFAAGFSFAAIAKASDSFTTMNVALVRLAGSQREATRLQGLLFQSAQASANGLEQTVSTFDRLANASRGLGKSNEDVIDVVTGLNFALSATGASAGDSEGLIRSLTKSLSLGRIEMEAFESFFRVGGGAIAGQIAAYFETTTQGLVGMVRSGKIGANELFEALQASSGEFERWAGQVPLRVSEATTRLSNSFLQYIGTLNQATGVMQLVSAGISLLATNFATIADSVMFGAAAYGIYRIALLSLAGGFSVTAASAAVFNAILGTTGVLLAFIAANPFTALLTALALGAAAMLTFGRDSEFTRVALEVLSATIAALGVTFTMIGEGIANVWEGYIRPVWEAFADAVAYVTEAVVNFAKLVLDALGSVGDAIGDLIPSFGKLGDKVNEVSGRITKAYNDSIKASERARTAVDAETRQRAAQVPTIESVRNANDNNRVAVDETSVAIRRATQDAATFGNTATASADAAANAFRRVASEAARASNASRGGGGERDPYTFGQRIPRQGERRGEVFGNGGRDIFSIKYGPTNPAGQTVPRRQMELLNMAVAKGIAYSVEELRAYWAAGGTEIPKFATGGQFMVNGRGGVDQNLVAFRASRGERVTVETRQQQRGAGAGISVGHLEIKVEGVSNPEEFRRTQDQMARDVMRALMRAVG